MTLKITLICGTRPEAIKLAPLYLELRRRPAEFTPSLWVTGQQRQMLDQALATFGLVADRDFDLMRPNQSLTGITAAVLGALEPALKEERPDMVLVQGDTTTAFAGALAAFYQRVAVGHVEAGLRTGDKYAPWPEEMNRRLAARLADLHFAPTASARRSLLDEGVEAGTIHVTGNTVIDALEIVARQVRRERPTMPEDFPCEVLETDRPMVLITSHRREHFGKGFESIGRALGELARRHPGHAFVFPLHLNPNVREPIHRLLGGCANVHLIEPLNYEPFVWAMDRCRFLLSDSGGVQEEAPHLGKPVLVLRDSTERPEALEAGTARLVGTKGAVILAEATRLIEDEAAYAAMSHAANPFGDGHASERIADILKAACAPD